MKKTIVALTVSAAVLAGGLSLQAGDAPASKPATSAPASKPAATSAPASQPAQGKLLATVGGVKIYSGTFDQLIAKAPPGIPADQVALARKEFLSDMIVQELAKMLAAARKAECTDLEFAAEKKKILDQAAAQNITPAQLAERGFSDDIVRMQVRMKKLVELATAKDKIETLCKAHPEYFNGTKVKASHILIACEPLAAQADQKAAREKLEKIAADIKAGKVSFEDAAKGNSACPSKEKGGDLGEFTFDRMVGPFSKAAFAMKTGEISGVVHTQFGYHLIKVTGREDGKTPAGPEVEQTAKRCLMGDLQSELFDMVLTTAPVVYMP